MRIDDPGSKRTGSVVTAGGNDLRALFEALRVLDTFELWVLVNEIGDRLLFEQSPSFVIGVLRDEGTHQNTAAGFSNLDVMLRIGRAVERSVPALVLLPPAVATPSPVLGVSFAQCPLDDPEALNLHLWAFLTALPRTSQLDATGVPRVPRVDVQQSLHELRILPDTQPALAQRFEVLMGNVFRQAGAKIVTNQVSDEHGSVGDRIDMAVVLSEDSPGYILAEVKAGRLSEEQLASAEQQLAQHVTRTRALMGIILYYDKGGRSFQAASRSPLIVSISAEDFISQLASQRLDEVVSNAAAHAVRGV